MSKKKVFQKIYYDSNNTAAFGGINKLYNAAKQVNPQITFEDDENWLKSQFTYTLHKDARKNYSKNKILVISVDEQWQADLVEVQEFSRKNKGVLYLMTIIHCFSRYAWVVPLKNKTGKVLADAFTKVFRKGRVCHKLQTDQGKEFVNSEVKNVFGKYGINHFTTSKTSHTK